MLKGGVILNLIDFHCDTIYKLRKEPSENLRKNSLSVDIEKLKNSGSIAQFFALYIDLAETKDPFDEFNRMAAIFRKELEANSDVLRFSGSYGELMENQKNGFISSFLTVEEGAALEGKISNLVELHRLGVRLITLTWNYPNEIGYPNFQGKHSSMGLTDFGCEVVEAMNHYNMIVDVSHLSDKGFYDVSEVSRKPFMASHSNARSVTGNLRNLTDDMIRILGNKGGIVGVNFEKTFLGNSDQGKVSEMIRHIDHIRNVGGIEVLAIGSDFDGIDTPPEISDISQMGKLLNALDKSGYTENEIEKIFYRNGFRFIQDTLS
jgi:membrane dipeptidase